MSGIILPFIGASFGGGQLYPFTDLVITGMYGRTAPTLTTIKSNTTTTGDSAFINNTTYFNATNGIISWLVPESATYTIICKGASGQGNGGELGGAGAVIQADVSLTENTTVKILVGQRVSTSASLGQRGGGGGGGATFLVDSSNNPILVAGAGGGSSDNTDGLAASTSTTAVAGTGTGGGAAGTGTDGGSANGTWHGSGGGGLTGDGQDAFYLSSSFYSYGGHSFTNGGVGGEGISGFTNSHEGEFGGFGGGGAGADGGGGGGGYAGGGGGGDPYGVGGGGSSYISGINQTSSADNTGTGYISISLA